MNNKELIVFHGTEGSPEENWFPWLKETAEKYGHIVSVPQFPTPDGQSLKSWLETYQNNRQLASAHPSIFVGHSIGATFALRLLERNLNGPRDAVFLASGLVGPLEDKKELKQFNDLNKTFYTEQFRWDKIREASKKFYVYHGTNDPYVRYHHAKTIADGLGIEVIDIKDGGHLNADAGFTKFERLWQDLKPLLDQETAKP